MRTVRFGVFETNSSSCHSITVCGKNKVEQLKKHEVVCVHKFHFYDDGEVIKNLVPDEDFIPIKDVYNKYIENKKIDIDFESFKKILFDDEKVDGYDFDSYDIRNDLEEYYGKPVFIYSEDSERNPFEEDLSDNDISIDGPIAVMYSEVYC